MSDAPGPRFDGAALIGALDERRAAAGLRWSGVADELTALSGELRSRVGDHAVCGGALVRTVQRQTMSCQYALMLLQWIGRAPEDFVVDADERVEHVPLPEAGPDRRLRWDLPRLYGVLDERRRESGLTWTGLGRLLTVSPPRLTNLRTAREADMGLAMRLTQWVGVPASTCVHAADR